MCCRPFEGVGIASSNCGASLALHASTSGCHKIRAAYSVLVCQGAVSVEGEAVLWKPKMPRAPASYTAADRADGGEDALLELANPGATPAIPARPAAKS